MYDFIYNLLFTFYFISSLLFIVFVNDIIEDINAEIDGIFTIDEFRLFLLLFADDQALFSTTPEGLQSMLSNIEIYCNKWQMQINTEKTQVMIFEKSRNHSMHDFFLYGQKLEIVLSFKYLSMYLFKNGFWLRSQRKLAESVSKSLHSLFTIFNKFDFTIKKKCDLFDSLVLPVVHYASEIWSYSSGTDIEVIHNKFCR